MTDVSVIIVNYKTAKLTIDCINSIYTQTDGVSFEVIVVDNDSGDDSVQKLSDVFGNKITIIVSDKNLGFGKGNNLGAKFAKGRYLLLLNPDTYLLNNAIKILFDYLEQHKTIGIAGGNLYFPDQTPAPSFCLDFDYPNTERKNASWVRILLKRIKDKDRNNQTEQKVSGFNYSNECISVGYIFGADMMIRRDVFDQVGGFDPDFFMYAEEEELSWRINKLGYQSINVPAARIVHLEGASTSEKTGFNQRQFSMRMNGKLIYYNKCFGKKGMESFYKARCLQYRRLLTIAKLRGKNITETTTYQMLECLKTQYLELQNK